MTVPAVGQAVIASTTLHIGETLTEPATITRVVHDASQMQPGMPHLVDVEWQLNGRAVERKSAPLFANEAAARENGNPFACWYAP
jgi:hypothetical protein